MNIWFIKKECGKNSPVFIVSTTSHVSILSMVAYDNQGNTIEQLLAINGLFYKL